MNPAVFEIAGHIVLKRAEDYAAVSEEWADRLLAAASLDDVTFQKVRDKYFFDGVKYFPGGEEGLGCIEALHLGRLRGHALHTMQEERNYQTTLRRYVAIANSERACLPLAVSC